jgi:hypothetical protein
MQRPILNHKVFDDLINYRLGSNISVAKATDCSVTSIAKHRRYDFEIRLPLLRKFIKFFGLTIEQARNLRLFYEKGRA